MNTAKIGFSALAGVLLFSATAFAGNTNKGNLHLIEKVSVEGKQLNPGNYKVEWEGAGSNVQVNILQGKETIATLPAHMVEQNRANPTDAYSSATETDGTKALTVIYVGGKKFALTFDQKQATQVSGSQTSK